MKLSPKAKRNLLRILPFGFIWWILGEVFLFIEQAAMGFENMSPETAITLTPEVHLYASITVFLTGMLMGFVEIVLLEKRFKPYSLLVKVLGKFILYLAFIFFLMIINFPIAASIELDLAIWDQEVLNKTMRFFTSITFRSTTLQVSFTILLSLFYAVISENLGHQVVFNFLIGKYHSPVEEERVFMFLDMKSSTTLAEKLGHVTWFKLLEHYYDAMSDAIINHLGEVYQYIGDEVVISWKIKDGIENQNCVRCFQAIGENLERKRAFFDEEFGVMPGFRAGIHLGEVTTGEIGALKKEIIFTGDVLNTTSRIQASCKEFEVDLLVSDKLAESLDPTDDLTFEEKGEVQLRGKESSLRLYALK